MTWLMFLDFHRNFCSQYDPMAATVLSKLLCRNHRFCCVYMQNVPTNELHACGYVSIGCEPCTRPVLPNQHEREGRWWWEDATGELRVMNESAFVSEYECYWVLP